MWVCKDVLCQEKILRKNCVAKEFPRTCVPEKFNKHLKKFEITETDIHKNARRKPLRQEHLCDRHAKRTQERTLLNAKHVQISESKSISVEQKLENNAAQSNLT